MNKKIKKFLQILFLVIVLLTVKFNTARADTTPILLTATTTDPTPIPILLTATTSTTTSDGGNGGLSISTPLNIQVQVDVPTSCNATDTNGVVHNYPEDSSSTSYLAICAVETAIKNGSISGVKLSNQYPEFGLFITSINGIDSDPKGYWAIYQNTNYASSGITSLPVIMGDAIKFQLNDSSSNNGDQVTLNIHSLISNIQSGGGVVGVSISGGGNGTNVNAISKSTFDITKALDFLSSQQKDNGSFGQSLYTDWSAVALVSGNKQDQVTKLIKYLGENKIESSNLTDYERHAVALMALGLNPYNTSGVNYITKIIAGFDGKQFGYIQQDNDDVFALIVLQNAGYTQNDKMIDNDISFVLGAQNSDGSWDNSVDMTGAAIEALSFFNQNEQARPNDLLVEQVKNALVKAENFLKQNQKDNGGWGDNASSTAWAIEGILAQGEKPEDWKKNGNTPLDYLATLQDTDGGIKDTNLQTKIWETSYVLSALSGKTWNQTMQKFNMENLPKVTPVRKSPVVAVAQKKVEASTTSNQNAANQNTASVINATSPILTTTQTETPKKNWFMRLLGIIFGSN